MNVVRCCVARDEPCRLPEDFGVSLLRLIRMRLCCWMTPISLALSLTFLINLFVQCGSNTSYLPPIQSYWRAGEVVTRWL